MSTQKITPEDYPVLLDSVTAIALSYKNNPFVITNWRSFLTALPAIYRFGVAALPHLKRIAEAIKN